MPLDRAVANILNTFGSVRTKKEAFCPISKRNMKIQREANKRKMRPTQVHVFGAIFFV